jgi:hypothetical protein
MMGTTKLLVAMNLCIKIILNYKLMNLYLEIIFKLQDKRWKLGDTSFRSMTSQKYANKDFGHI